MSAQLQSGFETMLKLRRRDFLLAGAGAALLPGVTWAGRRQSIGLAIGYTPESLDTEAATPMVTSADRLSSGEPELAGRDARVTIHGLLGDGRHLAKLGIRSMELRVGFPAVGEGSPKVAFRAWSYDLLPVEHSAAALAFRIPIDSGLFLELELETLGLERFETQLVTGRSAGLPKLRTGQYLIAPATDTFRLRRFDPQGIEPLITFSVEPADRFETRQLS